jgi:hypothetical protein
MTASVICLIKANDPGFRSFAPDGAMALSPE